VLVISYELVLVYHYVFALLCTFEESM